MTETPGGEILVCEAPDGGVRVDVRLDQDTVWLTQRQMAVLFDTTPQSVGYRVNSRRGVRFRQWATTTLREHLVLTHDAPAGARFPPNRRGEAYVSEAHGARRPVGPAPPAGLFLRSSPRASRRRRRWGSLHRAQSDRHAGESRRDRLGAASA